MPISTGPNSSDGLLAAYAKVDVALRVRQAKICGVLALVLVPACIGLDYWMYHDLMWRLFAGRILCDLFLLPCFLSLFTQWGQRHIKLIGNAPPLVPGLTICWMIYASEGVFSPYYAGLNIVMVGVILLIPYTLAEAIRICAIIVLCYAGACLMHRLRPPASANFSPWHTDSRTFFNNIYFLGMTAVIALAACHYNSVRRFEEFRLRFELDENNRQLADTLKKLQETEVQLVQSEKMNALGKLSAGLLHEINNPLNFTFMALQVAEQEIGENEGLKETLKDINDGMGRIRTVIADLRAFAYPTTQTEEKEFTLDEPLTTALRLTAHELNNISVERKSLDGVRAVGSPSQIVQVFMNLLINASHALKSQPLDRTPTITIAGTTAGSRLQVSVRDNGTGVAAAHLPRLLDPFFTTKPPGQGMGLGLSICHTIVKNHGGTLSIESEEGRWTQVTFDVPLASPSIRSAA
jgi:two-component system sensor histidine kinase PhcS